LGFSWSVALQSSPRLCVYTRSTSTPLPKTSHTMQSSYVYPSFPRNDLTLLSRRSSYYLKSKSTSQSFPPQLQPCARCLTKLSSRHRTISPTSTAMVPAGLGRIYSVGIGHARTVGWSFIHSARMNQLDSTSLRRMILARGTRVRNTFWVVRVSRSLWRGVISRGAEW
jgi:hypothetical protein